MADIRIGDYRMMSDAHGWKVARVAKRGPESANPGEEYLADESYHGPNAASAINNVLQRHLLASDATTLAELRDELDAFKAECASLFRLRIEA